MFSLTVKTEQVAFSVIVLTISEENLVAICARLYSNLQLSLDVMDRRSIVRTQLYFFIFDFYMITATDTLFTYSNLFSVCICNRMACMMNTC